MKTCNNCKYFFIDNSVGQAECINKKINHRELQNHFTNVKPECKYHEYDYININITVFNDNEKVFTGSAAEFLKDNSEAGEDINEMLIEVMQIGISMRDFYHSGIWEIIKI